MSRNEFRKIEKNITEPSEKKEIDEEPKEDIDDTLQNYYAEWSTQHEKILIEWADKAIVYRWLHSTSHISFASKARWFTIPVIIVSTLTGTANFAQERVPDKYIPWYNIAVGTANIIAGIVTTIQQFLKINELNEAHRVSSISWDKFYRNIKVELAKSRNERMNVTHMLKICKEEFDRLMETSPDIDENTIKLFQKTFSSGKKNNAQEIKNKKYQSFELVNKPEICDELVSTSTIIFKDKISDEETQKMIEENKKNEIAKKNKFENDKFEQDVNVFIKNFNEIHNREPTHDELFDNLSDKIDKNILKKILNRLNTLKIIEKV